MTEQGNTGDADPSRSPNPRRKRSERRAGKNNGLREKRNLHQTLQENRPLSQEEEGQAEAIHAEGTEAEDQEQSSRLYRPCQEEEEETYP